METKNKYSVFNRLKVISGVTFETYLSWSQSKKDEYDKNHPYSDFKYRLLDIDEDTPSLDIEHQKADNIYNRSKNSKKGYQTKKFLNEDIDKKNNEERNKKTRKEAFKKGLKTAEKTIKEDLKQGDYTNIERYKRLCKSKNIPLEVRQAYKDLLNNNGINVGY